MRLTADQVRNLPDGAKLKIFYSGSEWDEDFGKVFNAVKIGNNLYHFTEYDSIDDIDCADGYEIEVAIN